MKSRKRSYHTIRDFLFVIFKHKAFIVLVFLAVFSGGLFCSFFTLPVYEADSKLLLKNSLNSGIPISEKAAKQTSTMDMAVGMLKGRYLIEKTIKETGVKTLYPDIERKHFFGNLSGLQKAVLEFNKALSVRKGNLIIVKFQHTDPVLAANVVNKLIEEFLDYYPSVQKQNQKYDFFKKQVDLMINKLKASQSELGLFRNSNNISSITKQKSLLLLQISELEIEVSKVSAEISEQEGLAKSIEKASSEQKKILRKLIALKSKEKKLNQLITQYKLELNRLDKTETRLRELERQVNLEEENYLLYAKKLEEARISSAMDDQKIVNFSVIEPAMPPITPVKPHKAFIITISILLGFMGGLSGAFILEYFTHTFDNLQEMEETLGCAAVASFSELDRQETGFLYRFKVPDKIMKECNRIKHHLSQTLQQKNKTVLFSGSKEKEGTSTVLFSYAVTLASEGEKVLVVDANLRSPALHRLFKADRGSGLADLLAEKIPVENVIKKTQIENLMLITSGLHRPNPFLLFQSENWGDFMEDIKTKADWILFDSPPVNTYSDSCVISSKTDSFILVVKAGKTRWEVANSALSQMKQWNDNISGAVLNRKKMHIPEWLYKRL